MDRKRFKIQGREEAALKVPEQEAGRGGPGHKVEDWAYKAILMREKNEHRLQLWVL